MHEFNLQLFSEESTAVESPLATDTEVSTEGAEVDTVTEEDTQPSFDELIDSNPEYKKAYEQKFQDALNKRLKNQKDLQGQLDSMRPGLDILAQKYGLEAKDGAYDYADLMQKIQDDDKMYEEEAFQRGMSVQDLKTMKHLEAENRQLNAVREQQEEEARHREEFEQLMAQGEELKALYPSFDLGVELNNEQFGRLLANGIPLRTAFEVCHKDEILAGGMQYAVQQTKEKIANSIKSGTRPIENGLSSQSATSPGDIDLSKLTLAQIHDITARAQAGERITF